MISREPEGEPTRIGGTPRGGRRLLTVFIGIILILLMTLRGLATMWTDFLWYSSVGATSVWSTLLLSRIALAVLASLVAMAVIWVNLIVADRLSPRFQIFDLGPEEELVERFQEWIEARLTKVRLIISAIFGLMIGLGASTWWEDVLLFFNRQDFGIADPIFGHDAGLYVFQLPFLRDAVSWLFQLVVVTGLLIGALHYLNGGIRLRQGRPPQVSSGVKAHLSVLLAVLALLKAAAYRLDAFDLLYSPRGAVFGASYTDVNAHRPALTLLALISVFAAGLLLFNLRRRGWLLPAVAGGLWLVVSVVVGGIIPAGVQRFVVEPDELNRELPYIENHIAATREAYGLTEETVSVRQFRGASDLTADDLEANSPTIDNIRLWDPNVLDDTYQQLEEIRTYYQLPNVDVDRYRIDGELTQVMIAARELDSANLPASDWVNEKLIFTHGYGAVISPANAADAQSGEPSFYVREVPPVSTVEELTINQPRIYFGETTAIDEYVIVGTAQAEVDYPSGEGDAAEENFYNGAGGVPIGDIFRRAAFALRYGDLNTLISNQLTGDSRILMIRNITDRLEMVAPLLRADTDPYLALIEGRLVWIVDLYSVSDRFPYSQPATSSETGGTGRLDQGSPLPSRFNYIRNSVKAVVDAHDGTMDLYVIDDDDPLTRAYRQIFPDVFTDGDEMPDEVREHLRYPEDMFRVQSDMYAIYHVTNPVQWFQQEDLWDIPNDPSTSDRPPSRSGTRKILPYYLLMRLPGEEDLSYLALQSFNPRSRPNMTAFLVAKSEPGAYGELVDFRLPRGETVAGTEQIGARINQSTEISQSFSLWNQQGSRVIQGNILVVPIEESLVYIQPIYLQGEQLQLPEFQRVVVVFEDREPVMRESLDDALAALFGEGSGGPTVPPDDGGAQPPPTDDVTALVVRIDELLNEANQALARQDLGTYQAKIAEAAQLAEQLRGLVAPAEDTAGA